VLKGPDTRNSAKKQHGNPQKNVNENSLNYIEEETDVAVTPPPL
jgi:hypothetical protein